MNFLGMPRRWAEGLDGLGVRWFDLGVVRRATDGTTCLL